MSDLIVVDGTDDVYDLEKGTRYEEDWYWDGSNHISRATESQWDFESLTQCVCGTWIKTSTSARQESGPARYEVLTPKQALAWLVRNKHKVDMNDPKWGDAR